MSSRSSIRFVIVNKKAGTDSLNKLSVSTNVLQGAVHMVAMSTQKHKYAQATTYCKLDRPAMLAGRGLPRMFTLKSK